MRFRAARRIAGRELRGGLRGFRIFLICLALGVAAIAAVGSVGQSIERGLEREGATLLGGDAELEFTYRYASDEERAWMEATGVVVSEIVDFRSMAVVGSGQAADRALTQVKAVDGAYPLKGKMGLDPAMPLEAAFARLDGFPGAVMQRILADRLGLSPGDIFSLGTQDFRLSAILVNEPDDAGAGFSFGPRTIVAAPDLAQSGLIGPGTLFETRYRLSLAEGADLAALEAEARQLFRDKGARWRDARDGAPGVRFFVERLRTFLILVGLAGLSVGGVGVSAAVRAYLGTKTDVIATLKTLGADGRVIFLCYFMQIGMLTLLGIALGVVLGAALPLALSPIITAALPVPAVIAVYPGPLAEAALYGVLVAVLFTLWPLARASEVRPAALFRDAIRVRRIWPRWEYLLATLALLMILIGTAVALSETPRLTLWTAGAVLGALTILTLTSFAMRSLSRRLSSQHWLRGRTQLRLALGAIGGARQEAAAVVLSLGLGLTTLGAVGQIDANLRAAIARDLPEVAPSYFFVDIQNEQLAGFRERLDSDAGVSKVESAPMLRGIITKINGQPAHDVAGDHWVIHGDRGITYSTAPGPGTKITDGEWWPEDYSGPPLVSFAAEEAEEMGLKLGDRITINVLGRDIEAEITSFREVDFSTAGIGFILSMNPSALAGAPHSNIATVYSDAASEAPILRDLASAYPNITAIRVRDAIDRVASVLRGLASAISYGAAATLLTGFVVLIGAAAAGEDARTYEAAVLKTLGASRRTILGSFALRNIILGAAAGLVAIFTGILGGWAVMTYVMEVEFEVAWRPAVAIVAGGILATTLAGLGFVWRPLSARPAQVLRARE